jgi:2-keto-myo-inositol isomerase
MFDDWSDTRAAEALALMEIAVACGAEAVSLIPRNDGIGIRDGERQANLHLAMRELKPMLEEHNLIGMIEPLGFDTTSQRHKAEIVSEIEALNAVGRFKLVHDTFHHSLAGSGSVFPEYTGIVHISGVRDPRLSPNQMQDKDRGLVDADDQLDNIGQIKSLLSAGYNGPISFEAFSPNVHQFINPKAELLRSIHFIESQLNAVAALAGFEKPCPNLGARQKSWCAGTFQGGYNEKDNSCGRTYGPLIYYGDGPGNRCYDFTV